MTQDPNVRKLLSAAAQLFNGRKFSQSEDYCRKALSIEPQNPEGLNLLGVLADQAGHADAAIDLMRKSVEAAPGQQRFQRNLLIALLTHKRTEDAGVVATEMLRQVGETDDVSLLAILGSAIGGGGDLEKGIELLNKAVQKAPDTPSHHYNIAELYRRAGDREKAIAHLKQSLQIRVSPDTLNNLAGLQIDAGEFLEGLQTIQELLKVNPRSAQAHCNLGTVLRAAGELEQAVVSLRNAARLEPKSTTPRFHLANALIGVGELDEAEALMAQLSKECPEDPRITVSHARILERKGDIRRAKEIVESLAEEHKEHPQAAIMLATVAEQQGDLRKAIDILERLIEKDDAVALDSIGVQFSLGQYYDAIGDFEKAFERYQIGNENRRKAFPKFDLVTEPEAEDENRLLECYSADIVNRQPKTLLDIRQPVFIVGMPRSGTSLTEQILSRHPNVVGAGELTELRNLVQYTYEDKTPEDNKFKIVYDDPSASIGAMVPKGWLEGDLTEATLTQMANDYLDVLRKIGGEAERVTDKMPYNFLLLPIIHRMFPQATIIHTRRHPLDTCLSCYFQNFAGGSQFAFDLTELGNYYRKNYLAFMDQFRALEIPMLEIHYEDLVTDQETQVRQMLEYCGLEWDDQCLSSHKSKRVVSTASYQQVRKPVYTSSVNRWRNYEEHLEPLIEALQIDRAILDTVRGVPESEKVKSS